MTRTQRAGRTGDSRRRTGQGGVAIKRCGSCHAEVLSAYRGAVTAVGKGEIARVESNGDVVGRCQCGLTVTWAREIKRATVSAG
jgi:ferredoxin